MPEKKNMVIKVKYPTAGKAMDNESVKPNVITEWNVKRIGVLLAGLFLTGLAINHMLSDNRQESNNSLAQPLIASEQAPAIVTTPVVSTPIASGSKPVASPIVAENADNSQTIVRARLTHGIDRNEPIDQVKLPLKIGRKETLGIYYFVELKGMKGKTIYHEWLLNDALVSRKKVNISSDPWRTSSKQIISYTMNNDWRVRLVDEGGKVLNQTTFNLELK